MKEKDLEELVNEAKTPLEYESLKEYYQPPKPLKKGQFGWSDKQHWIFRFPNNYGASVIKHWGSFGWDDDLFELAVIKYNNKGNWTLDYTTEITDDVIGWLSNENVIEYLERIKEL